MPPLPRSGCWQLPASPLSAAPRWEPARARIQRHTPPPRWSPPVLTDVPRPSFHVRRPPAPAAVIMGNSPSGFSGGPGGPGGPGGGPGGDGDDQKKKFEPPAPPVRVGRRKKRRGPVATAKLPLVTPTAKCRLRLLKLERVKDYLLMEEEFVATQEQFKPRELKSEEERSKVRSRRRLGWGGVALWVGGRWILCARGAKGGGWCAAAAARGGVQLVLGIRPWEGWSWWWALAMGVLGVPRVDPCSEECLAWLRAPLSGVPAACVSSGCGLLAPGTCGGPTCLASDGYLAVSDGC